MFDTLVPTIKQGGKADILITGITITDKRSQEVDFTTSYLDSNQSLVVKSGSTETSNYSMMLPRVVSDRHLW